jgi:PII-like signaling protein
VVVEIVDHASRIERFLPILDRMIGSGLVTIEAVRAFQPGRETRDAGKEIEHGSAS